MPTAIGDSLVTGKDLDPEIDASDPDLFLTWIAGDDRPLFRKGLYARVSDASSTGCQAVDDWETDIVLARGLMVCVRTDRDRYAVLKILSMNRGDELVTYRIVYRDPT
jgi:hypothetical protein